MVLRAILVLVAVVGIVLIGTGMIDVSVDSAAIADTVGDTVDGVDGPPATDDRLKTVTNEEGFVRQIELYQSGAANITLAEDHGCFDTIEISHSESTTVYKRLDAPEFSGPVTVDLQSVIESHGPYPNNDFEVRVTGDGCVTTGPAVSTYVTVPDSWT